MARDKPMGPLAYERALRENLAKLAEQGYDDDIAQQTARREAAYAAHLQWEALRARHPLDAIDATTELTLRRDRDALEAEPDVVPTQLYGLNRMMCGFGGQRGLAHGWSVIIGARSNFGKTTLALNLAVWAAGEGENVLYIALEADAIDLRTRLLSIASGVHRSYLVYGDGYDRAEHERASEAITSLPGRIWLTSRPIYAMDDISEMILRAWEYQGVRTFIVDHLQLAQTGADKEIVRRVTEISHACRRATHEHRLLGISTSQLNRLAAVDDKRCPTMHDLLGGTSLESDSDVVLLIDHCKKHYRYDALRSRVDTMLRVGKNRHGPRGEVPIRFDYTTHRAEEGSDTR